MTDPGFSAAIEGVLKGVTFDPVVAIEGDKPFRTQARRVHLTYRTHIDKVALEATLRENTKKCGITAIYMAHETADENHPYEHTHVLVDFGKIFNSRSCRIFDHGGVHPNVKPVLTHGHWKNGVQYLAKEDPANADLKDFMGDVLKEEFNVDDIWKCATMIEVMQKFCTKPGDATGLKTIYDMRPDDVEVYNPKIKELRPFQAEVLRVIAERADDRTFYFVIDELTKQGKRALGEHIEGLYPQRATEISLGRPVDMFEALWNDHIGGNALDIIICDAPKGHVWTREHFATLEAIKNGRWTKTKNSVRKYRKKYSPHLIIFTNEDVSHLMIGHGSWLSPDRFQGIRLGTGGTFTNLRSGQSGAV